MKRQGIEEGKETTLKSRGFNVGETQTGHITRVKDITMNKLLLHECTLANFQLNLHLSTHCIENNGFLYPECSGKATC